MEGLGEGEWPCVLQGMLIQTKNERSYGAGNYHDLFGDFNILLSQTEIKFCGN